MKLVRRIIMCMLAFIAMDAAVAAPPGQDLFVEKCAMSHRQMGMGTLQLMRRMPADQALLENRVNLAPQYIEYVVRNGLGIMFSLSRAEVSDEQLQQISAYLAKEAK